jgi:hypothetical protein
MRYTSAFRASYLSETSSHVQLCSICMKIVCMAWRIVVMGCRIVYVVDLWN